MSEIKVDKISPQSGTALQIGDASDVITIPASATITNNGTANGFGKVLQVVQNHVNTLSSQSIVINTVTNISNLSCAITPASTSSKILVSVRWNGESSTSGFDNMFGLKRGSTEIGSSPTVSTRGYGISINLESNRLGATNDNSTQSRCAFEYIDSPATASAVTYYMTVLNRFSALTLWNNKCAVDSDSSGFETSTSTITLTELSAATTQVNGA